MGNYDVNCLDYRQVIFCLAKTVVVLGGGAGGVAAVNVLSKTLSRNNRIILVDRKESYHFQGAFPLLMVNQRRPAQLTKRLDNLERKGIEFFQAEVKQIRPQQNLVDTSRESLCYDYLVIALGAEHHPETVPGMAEGSYNPWRFEGACQLRHKLSRFKRGKIVFFMASTPFSCPIAPYEIIFLLDDYYRRRGLRQQVELTLVTPEPTPEPLAGPKVGESVRQMMEERGITLITQAKVLCLDTDQNRLLLDHGIEIPGDLFIGVPSHWGPAALRGSGLTEEGGWVDVDPHTLNTRAENVFAIGDAAALKLPVTKVWAPKAGIFAHYQGEVVARNIASLIAGECPSFRYTAKGFWIMLTGSGRARYCTVRYRTEPKALITMLRPTRAAYLAKLAIEKYWLVRWF
jgi:sulfide:quinone oxidoreductase